MGTKTAIEELDYQYLKILKLLENKPLQSSELKEHVELTWAMYSRRLKWLLSKGLIKEQWVVPPKTTRPIKIYALTEKGREVLRLCEKIERLVNGNQRIEVLA